MGVWYNNCKHPALLSLNCAGLQASVLLSVANVLGGVVGFGPAFKLLASKAEIHSSSFKV